jgi:hypothetical protein
VAVVQKSVERDGYGRYRNEDIYTVGLNHDSKENSKGRNQIDCNGMKSNYLSYGKRCG